MEDALKSFVKKLNNPFASSSSSSSSRFKGEGRRLGRGESRSDDTEKKNQATTNQAKVQEEEDERRKRSQQERWGREEKGNNQTKYSEPDLSSKSTVFDSDGKSKVQEGFPQVSLSKPFENQSIGSSVNESSLAKNEKKTPVNISCDVSVENEREHGFNENTKHSLLASGNEFDGNINSSFARNGLKEERGSDLDENTNNSFARNGGNDEREKAFDNNTGNSSARNPGNEKLVNKAYDVNRIESEKQSGFDPFSSLIGSKSSSIHGNSLQMFQCPVCDSFWRTEVEVNTHVDECLRQSSSQTTSDVKTNHVEKIKISLGAFLSGGPSNDTINVILKIFHNIVNNPDLEKYRKIRLSNPKIHDTIGTALGGVELLMAMGFEYETEEDEIWAVMASPSNDQLQIMKSIISELEGHILGPCKNGENSQDTEKVHRKVDRKVRVFYSVPENLAARINLPDSFYNLSAAELRQEAATRKKKLEDSQLLVSRISRERANKRKYKAAIIRIQFPDGVVLQGMFLPWEQTSAIYEFVSSALRNPATQFDLIAPILTKNQIIPSFSQGSIKVPTLEEANLVPATLVKFKCSESESLTFTGLHPDFLTMMEPLSTTT